MSRTVLPAPQLFTSAPSQSSSDNPSRSLSRNASKLFSMASRFHLISPRFIYGALKVTTFVSRVSLIKVVRRNKFSVSKSQKQPDRLIDTRECGRCTRVIEIRGQEGRLRLHVPLLDKIAPLVACTSEDETNRFFSTTAECLPKKLQKNF